MKKVILGLATLVILFLNLGLASSITAQEIKEAKGLIDSKVDCKSLSDSQLELIGEYTMELMHPGSSHEAMHKMMGIEEGTKSEEQFHINMAKIVYCGERYSIGGGMMNMMVGNIMGPGMMGGTGYGYGYFGLVNVLYILLLIGLVILVYLWILKLWRSLPQKRK